MSELADSIRSAVGKPFWSRATVPFSKFQRDLEDYLSLKDLAEVLFAEKFELDPLEGAPLKKANNKVFAILRQGIPDELYNSIDAECTADAAAAGEGEGDALLLSNKAPLLWTKIVAHSHGALPALAGNDLRSDIRAWTYPAGPHKTHVELVNLAIAEQTELVTRAAALQDANAPHTPGQACNDILSLLPPLLRVHSRAYRAYQTLPRLRAELLRDARDLDEKPELVALVAALTGDLSSASFRSGVTPALVAATGGGGRDSSTRKRVHISHTRRMDKSQGPPWPGSTFCSKHGWCGHVDAKCSKQLPDAPPVNSALAAVAAGGAPLYEQLPNGDFQRVLLCHDIHQPPIAAPTSPSPTSIVPSITAPLPSSTTTTDSLPPLLAPAAGCLLASSAVTAPTYVDCGGSVSLVKSVHTEGCLPGSYSPFPTPRLVGGIGSGVSATGAVERVQAIRLPHARSVVVIRYWAYVVPDSPYEIVATNDTGLGGLGISSKQDAELPGCPVVLELPGLDTGLPDDKLWCVPYNGLWILPTVPFAGNPPPRGVATLVSVPPTSIVAPSHPPIGAIVTGRVVSGPTTPIGGVINTNTSASGPGVIFHPPVGGIVCVAPSSDAPPPPVTTPDSPPSVVARYASVASRFGVSKEAAVSLASCMGIQLSHKTAADAVAYDSMTQRVTQAAASVAVVEGTSSAPAGASSFGCDTLGGKFPRSFTGNHFAIVFMDHTAGKRNPSVSVFASHHAANTCTALAAWISESRFPLLLDGSLQPHIHCYMDNGTELRGDFDRLLTKHGVQIHRSTAYKHNTARTSIIENMNRQLQRLMRINLGHAAAHLRAFGFSPTLFWDFALRHAARQITVRNLLRTVDHTDAHACRTARKLAARMLPFSFGQRVSATLQLGSPSRSTAGNSGYNKQLADRALPTIFLGVDRDGRYALLAANGHISYSIDAAAAPFDPRDVIVPLTVAELAALGYALACSTAVDNSPDTMMPPSPPDIDSPTEQTGQAAVADDLAPAQPADTDALVQIPTADAGVMAQIGSRVHVFWPAEKCYYTGVVTATTTENASAFGLPDDDGEIPAFHVDYDDGDSKWHRISEASETVRVTETAGDGDPAQSVLCHVERHVQPELQYDPTTEYNTGLSTTGDDTVLMARAFVPHPSVQQFFDDRGQIHSGLLNGDTDLPPMPPLPDLRRSSASSPPGTVRQALQSEHAIFWLQGMITEHVGHVQTPTFKYVNFENSSEARDGLNAKWVFDHKWDGDSLAKFRSRLVLAGFDRTKGVHYKDTYLSAPPIDTMRFLECIAVLKQWHVFESDLTRAYNHAFAAVQPNGHRVTARMPNFTRTFDVDGRENAIEAIRSMYGFPAAGYEFGLWLTQVLLSSECPFTLTQNRTQPCLYSANWATGHRFAGEYYVVYVHSDNVLHYSSSKAVHTEFMDWYETAVTVTGGRTPLQDLPPTTRLGMLCEYGPTTTSFTWASS
jgi:hypothetical protein